MATETVLDEVPAKCRPLIVAVFGFLKVPVGRGILRNRVRRLSDSQAENAGSIPVARSKHVDVTPYERKGF